MTDADRKRDFVAKMYRTESWKMKVAKMSDAQITAIYLREQAKITAHKPPKKDENDDGDIPF